MCHYIGVMRPKICPSERHNVKDNIFDIKSSSNHRDYVLMVEGYFPVLLYSERLSRFVKHYVQESVVKSLLNLSSRPFCMWMWN